MSITRYRFARPKELRPKELMLVTKVKAAVIRSTELMLSTGNDASRTTDSPFESGKRAQGGGSR